MLIKRANPNGFCFGVKRAVTETEAELQQGSIYALGALIHNQREIDRLGAGLIEIKEPEQGDLSISDRMIIRAHGTGPEVYKKAEELGFSIKDFTCPFVKKVQREAVKLAEAGRAVIIIGDAKHPEVQGIKAWSGENTFVVNSPEDIAALPEISRAGVVVQTTYQKALFEEFCGLIKARCTDIEIHNTICSATADRQQAIAELAKEVQHMVIVGGKNSANTKKLLQICQAAGVSAQLVEGAFELDLALFDGCNAVGVSAGASTPEWIIEEVVTTMEEMNIAVDTVEAVEAAEAEVSFADIYESEMTEIHRGSRVKGIVVQIRNDELLVDIGGKSEGLLPSNQLMANEAADIQGHFKVGDEIEVIVLKKENKEGYPVLSKKMVDQVLVWEKLAAAQEAGEHMTGKIVDVVKGGLLIDLGIRGFIPASLVDLRYVEDLKAYVGQEVTVKILECDRAHNKLLLSRKAVLLSERHNRREQLLEEIAEGQTRKGTVSRLTNFGAFIDLGGVDGLLHVSEMAWYRVNQPADILKEGDELDVYVISYDKDTHKISLGLKQLIPNPWSLVADKYPVGSIVTATVMRTADFGAFLQLEPGVEGLVHISQLSRQRVAKTSDAVKPGDVVEVKVLDIDTENKRMSLSIKETLPVEEVVAPVEEEVVEEVAAEEVLPESHEEELNTTLGDLFPADLKVEE